MNDQQSPPAFDPQFPQPPQPVSRTYRESALSDQETFALLAESMANGRNGNGTNGQPANGHAVNGNGTNGHAVTGHQPVNSHAVNGHQPVNGHSVDDRIGDRPTSGQDRLASDDHRSGRKGPLSKFAPTGVALD